MVYVFKGNRGVGYNLDPRTKIILMILINVVIYNHSTLQFLPLIMVCLICSLLILNKKYKAALISISLYLFVSFLLIYVLPYVTGIIAFFIVIMVVLIYNLMPCFIMGYYIVLTTTVSEFVASMEEIKMPQEIIIPLSVLFRFVPTVFEEAHSIADAMKMSGLGLTVRNIVTRPLKMFEYWFIPLIMATVKIGDDLSAAVLTRSMDNPVKRTNICEVGFHRIDFIYLSISIILTAVGLIF